MWGHSSSLVIESCVFRKNVADRGGGGLRFDASDSLIANSLFVQNIGQNAGAIRFDNGNMTLKHCTIADNTLAGETGGGIYSGGGDSLTITNSIFWGDDVDEIYIEPEDYFEPNITYTDIQGGWAGVGNIDADPMFVRGVFHDYYLSHTAAGQPANSPCIEAGSDTAENLGLNELTTRNDSEPDVGTVDMGHHAPPYDGLYITWISRSGHHITIHWNALPGACYTVQYSTDLEHWTSIPAGETNNWTDTSASGYTKKFYRVFEQ